MISIQVGLMQILVKCLFKKKKRIDLKQQDQEVD